MEALSFTPHLKSAYYLYGQTLHVYHKGRGMGRGVMDSSLPHFWLDKFMPSYSRCIYILPNTLEEKYSVHLVYEYDITRGKYQYPITWGGGHGGINTPSHVFVCTCMHSILYTFNATWKLCKTLNTFLVGMHGQNHLWLYRHVSSLIRFSHMPRMSDSMY